MHTTKRNPIEVALREGRDAMDDTAEQHIESAVFDKVKDTMLNNVPQG